MWYRAECVRSAVTKPRSKVVVAVATASAFVQDFMVGWVVYVQFGGCDTNDRTYESLSVSASDQQDGTYHIACGALGYAP
jgi:hypothetical protein